MPHSSFPSDTTLWMIIQLHLRTKRLTKSWTKWLQSRCHTWVYIIWSHKKRIMVSLSISIQWCAVRNSNQIHTRSKIWYNNIATSLQYVRFCFSNFISFLDSGKTFYWQGNTLYRIRIHIANATRAIKSRLVGVEGRGPFAGRRGVDRNLGPVSMEIIRPKSSLDWNLVKSRLSVASVLINESFWNFAQSTAVGLPCSVQNVKTIRWLKN